MIDGGKVQQYYFLIAIQLTLISILAFELIFKEKLGFTQAEETGGDISAGPAV